MIFVVAFCPTKCSLIKGRCSDPKYFFHQKCDLISDESPYFSYSPCEILGMRNVYFRIYEQKSSELLSNEVYHHSSYSTVQWEHRNWNFASHRRTKGAMQFKFWNKTIFIMYIHVG